MLATNQTIGDYVIKTGPFGGLSGFGELYKAAHVSDLNNLVAFKLSKHQTADDESRFRLENEILHELKGHKGIIVPHTGILEDKKLGILYYCMELADTDIAEYLATNGPLEEISSLNLFKQTCEAVKHAHERRVVHRDLHNKNILVKDNADNETEIKLTDFGRAKFFNGALSTYGAGTLWGRYDTRAPESFFEIWSESDLHKYAMSSDIYSLGVILAFLFNIDPSTFISEQLKSIALYFYQSDSGQVVLTPSIGLWINDMDTAEKKKHYELWLKSFSYKTHSPLLMVYSQDKTVAEKVNAIILKCCNPRYTERYKSVNDIIKELETIC